MKNQKRKLPQANFTAFVAASIDGRISASARSELRWTSKEDWNFFQKSLQKFDAVVAGYNTFRVAEARLKKRKAIIFTSKADKLKSSGSVVFFNPQKSDFKKFIKTQ